MTKLTSGHQEKIEERNWAGNLAFNAFRTNNPAGVGEILALVAHAERLKGLGSRHSFTPIADTEGILVSPQLLGQEISLDVTRREVTVPAGVRYGELAEYLSARGYALPNLASLPHISVVGACATATHGSGVRNGNLATSVRAFDLVTGGGDFRQLSLARDGEKFNGAVVHLGALGVVTSITLEVVPAFRVAQTVYHNLSIEALLDNFDEVMSSAYSVSLFTDWGSDTMNQVWLKDRVDGVECVAPRTSFYGARPAAKDVHPVAGMSGENCSPQMGVPGPWHRRLPHFKLEHTPSVGDELQTEYFVSRSDAPEAIRRLSALTEKIHPLVLISELRTVAADSLWLSPNYHRDSVGIHFTWKHDMSRVLAVLPVIEEALADLKPTPHWAKLSTMPAEVVRSRFPRLADFGRLARELDPEGRCHNDFLRKFVL